jgi:hypothetical protein
MATENVEIVAGQMVRSVVHPRVTENGVLSPYRMMRPNNLKKLATGGKGLGISVGNKAALADDDAVHDFGCRVANKATQAERSKAEKNGTAFSRPENSVHYLASLDCSVEVISRLESPIFAVGVVTAASDGLDEHCRIELRPKVEDWDDPDNDFAAEARTDLIERLFSLLTNPRSKLCPCDAEFEEYLEPKRVAVMEFFAARGM